LIAWPFISIIKLMSDEGQNLLKIISIIGSLPVIIIFTVIYFLYPETNVKIFIGITAACFCIFIYNALFDEYTKSINEETALKIQATLYSLLYLNLVHATGGLESPLYFGVYFLVIFGFIHSGLMGVLGLFGALVYTALDLWLFEGAINLAIITPHIPKFGGLVLTSVVSSFYGSNMRNTEDEKSKMQSTMQKLSADKNKDEAILTNMADGVYAVDNNRKIVIFNKAAEEMTGWKAQDAIGLNCQTVMKLKDDKDLSVCEKSCPMLLTWSSDESVVRNDMCFINAYKKTLQVSGSYAPIKNLAGEVTGGLCVFRDITKQIQLDREKNEFISTASHEMRTPLTAMEGYIELIENPKICQVDEKGREYLEKAKTQVIGMSRLMKDLLSITKLEEGKLEIVKQSFEIKELIKNSIEILTKMAAEKNLELRFNESNISFGGKKAIGLSTRVSADPDKVREVLNNLIENAIKYTKEGFIEIYIAYDQDFATVCVADTGVGISPDDQKHIFQKFYQVADYETREVGGTGLGLYITRSLVEANGGKIWVESKKGEGSKFFFTIPRALD
jgi:PAS domain S-box-containing protein